MSLPEWERYSGFQRRSSRHKRPPLGQCVPATNLGWGRGLGGGQAARDGFGWSVGVYLGVPSRKSAGVRTNWRYDLVAQSDTRQVTACTAFRDVQVSIRAKRQPARVV